MPGAAGVPLPRQDVGQLLVALQVPVCPFATSTYDPDMLLLPETVPEYVTTPTAPKLMPLPDAFPLISRVSGGDESLMVPLKADPVCVHVSVNVPLNGPLYCPDHDPETSTAVGAAVGVGVAATGVGVAAGALLDSVGVGVFDEEPHAAKRAAAVNPVVNITIARFIRSPFCFS